MTVSTGKISTIAGDGSATFSGDGGQATSASLYYSRGVALDSSGFTHSNFLSHFKIIADFILTTYNLIRQRVYC